MKKNITFVSLGVLLFALCVSAHARQPGKIFRIGVLETSTASAIEDFLDTFR